MTFTRRVLMFLGMLGVCLPVMTAAESGLLPQPWQIPASWNHQPSRRTHTWTGPNQAMVTLQVLTAPAGSSADQTTDSALRQVLALIMPQLARAAASPLRPCPAGHQCQLTHDFCGASITLHVAVIAHQENLVCLIARNGDFTPLLPSTNP